MSETALVKQLMLRASELGARLFRNNVGVGWAGSHIVKCSGRRTMNVTLRPGDVVVRNARPLHAGLCKGSSDLIGWRPYHPPHGDVIAQFLAVEVKTKFGRLREGQREFIDTVNEHGGRAGVVRSLEDFSAHFMVRGTGEESDD